MQRLDRLVVYAIFQTPNKSQDTNMNLSSALRSLTNIKAQSESLGGEGNLGALLKVQNVALDSLDLLAGLITDLELAIYDDFHLVVGVGVYCMTEVSFLHFEAQPYQLVKEGNVTRVWGRR
jgi:hypothetical protein